MKYAVLTLDLVNSRQMPNRGLVQTELKAALTWINDQYADVIRVPFDFTLGDEVQGVLSSLSGTYQLVGDFQRLLHGHHFYSGIGYGDILTELSERSGAMDGPAFHLARQGVEALKKEHPRGGAGNGSGQHASLIRYTFSDEKLSRAVNNYLSLVELLKVSLTEKQREVYELLKQVATYSEVAARLGQSKSAITQKVQAGHIEELRAGEAGFVQLLNWIENTQVD